MNFLYPKFDKETHQTVENSFNTSVYPKNNLDFNGSEFSLPKDTKVAVIRENVGYDCQWSLIKLIDKKLINNIIYGKELYILKKHLINIGNKETYEPLCSLENNIDLKEPEIDPNLKEILIPYVDKLNGLYSVRIQVDQERIIDNILFEQTLRDVYYEGLNILLASRGFKSDNKTIENLSNKFYTFGFINKDLDLTVNRRCEQLTFTVSLPLNFFNGIPKQDTQQIQKAKKIIRFTNDNFLSKINVLLNTFTSKAGDILRLTYPDKIIENFIVDFEVLFIKKFAISANDLFSGAGYPIKTDVSTSFEIGFSDDFEILYIKVEKENEEKYLSTGFVSQAKLLSSFNSKRVFNYLFNFNSMMIDINNLEIYDFLIKYVKYPDAKLANATVIINNEVLPNEKLKLFAQIYNSQSEECISLSDVTGLIEDIDTITSDVSAAKKIVLGDPLFHLYVDTLDEQEDEPVSIIDTFNDEINWMKESQPTNEERKEKENRFAVQTVTEDKKSKPLDKKVAEDASKIDEQLSEGNKAALNALKKKYSFSAQTLFYIANRINFNKYLFQHIFCYLKGIDPNSNEAKLITSTTPELIIRYFYYLYRNRNLKGKELVKLAATGLPFDLEIFCSKNSALTYFIKGLLTFVKGIANFNIPQFVTQLKSFQENKTDKPYKIYREALILETEKLATDILFQIIRDLLQYSCEEDNLFNTGNDDFRDPFSTHIPLSGFGGQITNNDKDVVNKNRKNVLDSVYSKEVQLQYGFDSEFQIDLLDRLMIDIRCVLSPIEGVNLLQGNPTPLVINLIVNLIKNKYSKQPNDLSFLLDNKDKLKLFFKKLGLTVDKEYMTVITPVIVNGTSASDLCDPQQIAARADLLENKLPKNLGILEDQLRKRAIKARTIFETIQNGQIEIPYNPFCPDQFGNEVGQANEFVLQEYYSQIRKIFEPSMKSFNDESRKLPALYEDPEFVYRRDDSGIFDLIDFKVYNYTLATNFQNFRGDLSTFKFVPSFVSFENLSDLYLPEKNIETLAIGCEFDAGSKDDFYNFLTNEDSGLFAEIIYIDRTFEDTGRADDLNRYYGKNDTRFAEAINSRKFFMTITVDMDLPWGANQDRIEFKFFYNDKKNNRFKLLKNIAWEDVPVKNIIPNTNFESSEDFAQTLINITTNQWWNVAENPIFAAGSAAKFGWHQYSNSQKWATHIGRSGSNWSNGIIAYSDNDNTNDIARFSWMALEFLRLDPENNADDGFGRAAAELIQSIYEKDFRPIINQIKQYEEISKYIDLLNEYGLFNIKKTLDTSNGKKKLIHKINVSTVNNVNGEPSIVEKEYATFEQEIDDDYDPKFIDPLGIAGEIGYKLENKYFKTFSTAYDYSVSKFNTTTGEYELYKDTTMYATTFEGLIDGYQGFKEKFLYDKAYKFSYLNNNNPVKVNYEKFSLFDYPKDNRFYSCNITPHYFNIDRFLASALDSAKTEVCKGFDAILDNMIKEVAINLLFRTYVTDLMIKAIPFLSGLSKERLDNAFKNDIYVNALLSIILKDMETFGGNDKITNQSISVKYFTKIAKEVFDSYKEKNKLIPIFNIDGNPLKYFIRKEIKHFIKYSIAKDIFRAGDGASEFDSLDLAVYAATNETSFSERKLIPGGIAESLIIGGSALGYLNIKATERQNYKYTSNLNLSKDSSTELIDKYSKIALKTYNSYHDSYFSFFIMSGVVDYNKKISFSSTKQGLLNILFSLVVPESEEESQLISNSTAPSQEDVIKFINDLSTSNIPALLVQLKPKYSKYLIYFIEQSILLGRRISLTVAEASDKNIFLTRRINTVASYVQSLLWSITPQEQRDKLIAENTNIAQKLFWKRMESGKSIIPDLLISLGVSSKGITTTGIGNKYLFFDTLAEGIWYARAVQEMRSSIGLSAQEEPCAIVNNIPQIAADNFVCTPENKIKLIKEIDSFDEP